MAIDTAEERRCVGGNMPTPDSTISLFDRRQIAGNYRGIPVLLSKGGTLNINKSTLATNLVGWWPLSQANYQGGVFVDESGNNNDGTPANAPNFTNDNFRNPAGSMVCVAASQDFVNAGSPDITTSSFSLSLWIKHTTLTNFQRYINLDLGGLGPDVGIGSPASDIRFRTDNGGVNQLVFAHGMGVGTWYHWVFVYDTTIGFLAYKNGALLASDANSGLVNHLMDDFIIGKLVSSGYADAKFFDARIYTRALSLAEIKLLYTPSLAMLLELYRDVSGGMTPTGVLARALTAYRGLGGGLTPIGAVIPAPFFEMVLGGELDLYGAIAASNPDWLLIDDLLTWMGEWDETWSYDIDDVVLYKISGGNEWHVFVSKISHNVGNIPTRVASAWRRLYQEQWL